MLIGILQFDIHIHDSRSLKDKRRVILALKDRLHREHQVAVAEIAHQDTLNLARLGLAIVGSDGKHVGQTLDRLVEKIRTTVAGEAELGEVTRKVAHIESMRNVSESKDDADTATLADEMAARARELLGD